MKLIGTPQMNEMGRFYTFYLQNDQLLENKTALEAIYNTLMSNETFLNFGNKKVILITAKINSTYAPFHHNILIENTTSFYEYYEEVKDLVQENYEYGIITDTLDTFLIRV